MSFSFIQITDHHLTESDTHLLKGFSTRYAFRSVLKHVAQNTAQQVDFIISTGDIVENPTELAYQALKTRGRTSEYKLRSNFSIDIVYYATSNPDRRP